VSAGAQQAVAGRGTRRRLAVHHQTAVGVGAADRSGGSREAATLGRGDSQLVPNAPMAALAPRCCWLHAAMHAMPAIALAAMMAAAGIHRPMRGGPVSERMHVNGVQLCVRLYSRTRCSYGCTRTHCSCCLQGARSCRLLTHC
jgi:hypothetical protein